MCVFPYQAFKNQEGVFKDLVVFDSQNNIEKKSLYGVQGDCLYILFSSFSKLV